MSHSENYLAEGNRFSSQPENTGSNMKEKIGTLIYPAIGTMGMAYQIYLLVSR